MNSEGHIGKEHKNDERGISISMQISRSLAIVVLSRFFGLCAGVNGWPG